MALLWQNRTTNSAGIIIQRKTDNEEFANYAELSSSSTLFYDTNVKPNTTYYYRVITNFNDQDDYYSYPVKYFLPNERSSFLGEPFNIPGTIEAEDFDIGGEGLTYHDTDTENIPGDYRPNESVDIEERVGGFHIAYISTGEWVEYTVNVEQSGEYYLTVYLASLDGGGKLSVKIGSNLSETITVPKTSNWTTFSPVTVPISLTLGKQILRINFISAEPFNLDKLSLALQNPNSVKSTNNLSEFKVYPNPVHGNLNVKLENIKGESEITVFNILGEEIATLVNEYKTSGSYSVRFNATGLASGVYLYELQVNNYYAVKKLMLLR